MDAVVIVLGLMEGQPHWLVWIVVTRSYGWFCSHMRRKGMLDG